MGGPPVPFLEERLGIIGGLDVELLEGEAHAVCPPGLEVRGGEGRAGAATGCAGS